MGYNISRTSIHSYADFLEIIRLAVDAGEECAFDCHPEDIAREQYNLRQALKSAEVFGDLYEGRYKHLGPIVSIGLNTENNKIIVKSKIRLNTKLSLPDERNALASLDDATSRMVVLEFHPSPRFNEPVLVRAAERKGWKIFTEARAEDAHGKMSYPAERTDSVREEKKGRGFSSILLPDEDVQQ